MVNAREMKAESVVFHMSIYAITDLKATFDSQWLLVAYQSGGVNLHNMGDRSMNNVCQIA